MSGSGDSATPNEQNKQPPSDDNWDRRFSIWSLIISNAVVLVTAAVGFALLIWQSTMMRESNALTRKSVNAMLALERPHVVIETITQPSLSSRSDAVIAQLRNIGRSAAESVEVRTVITSIDKATELPCEWSRKRMAASGLGPGQDTGYTTDGIDITQPKSIQIQNNQVSLFLWLSISYTDALGEARQEPPSCYVVTGTNTAGFGRPPTKPWRRCESTDFKPNARASCDPAAARR